MQTMERLPVDLLLATAGDGLWSAAKTALRVHQLAVTVWHSGDDTWGELRAYFDPALWRVEDQGLIYTDSLWIHQLREWLNLATPLGAAAIAEVDYSEQGMQAADYVSMDVDARFVEGWQRAGFPVERTVDCDL
jgi:hypothetical protein